MYFIKALLVFIWFAAVPFCIGGLPLFQTERKEKSWLLHLVCGYTVMFALFEVLALPMIFAGLSFATLKYVYGAACVALALTSLVFMLRERPDWPDIRERFLSVRKVSWTMWVAVLLIAVQMAAYVFGMATDLDDAFYVATATTTVETGGMFQYGAYTGLATSALPARYVLAPFPVLLAFFSSATLMHPAVIAHTVQPVFFLLLSYTVYGFIGERLFGRDQKAIGLFLFFLALVQMFSSYSVYMQGTFMLTRIWQGKALLASFLLPALFIHVRWFMENKAAAGDWLRLLCLAVSACLVSSMGMILAPVMVGLLAFLYGVPGLKWRKMMAALACCLPNVLLAVVYVLVK